jgi:CheY-like chemotaxis protein
MDTDSARTGTILVVDDDEIVRNMLAEVLQEGGFQVQLAADGREALALLDAAAPPRLILLDLTMPTMDGWAFARHLQEDPGLGGLPVIVLTGCTGEDVATVPLTPVASFIKPFSLPLLLATIAHHCQPPVSRSRRIGSGPR